MSTANPFAPAVKERLKARIALSGPSGSGKTYTALRMAKELAGKDGKIAMVDTEHRSASLYADLFQFDTADFTPPYVPQRLIDMLNAAAANGYAVAIVDSGTHFWSGPGGILEIVDKNAKGGNSWSGWAVGTPIQQAMIDALISVDMHVIMCMRSKQEWALQTNANGKQEPVRIGLAPQQRGDIEYEFTVFGELDLQHRLTVTKTRCPLVADLIDVNPGEAFARTLLDWLDDGADPNKRYVDIGWKDRDEHDTARDEMLERGRTLNKDQQAAMREERTNRRLPSSSSQFFTRDEMTQMFFLLNRFDSKGELDPVVQGEIGAGDDHGTNEAPSAAENAPVVAQEPENAAGDVPEPLSLEQEMAAHVADLGQTKVVAELGRLGIPVAKTTKQREADLVEALVVEALQADAAAMNAEAARNG